MIQQARREYSLLQHSEQSKEELFAHNCKVFGLTVRESEIAKLLGSGLPYKIVASTLNISEKTVAKHVSNIFAKVKVTNKVELILKLEDKHLSVRD
jgi:DNA-binding NarL/FixJ family response regulator